MEGPNGPKGKAMNGWRLAAPAALLMMTAAGLCACGSDPTPAPATVTVQAPTPQTDPHLTAFQNALDGAGINVRDAVAKQWGSTVCNAGDSVNDGALALDQGVLSGSVTVPNGQTQNIAELAKQYYC